MTNNTHHTIASRRLDWRTHIAVTVMTGLLAGLGVWQVLRLGEKQDLLQTIETNMSLPPIGLEAFDAENNTGAGEYRLVRVRGVFEPEANIRIMSRVHDGRIGVHIATPLRDSITGRHILVDRGWAPADWVEPRLPPRPVEVTGLVRGFRAASLMSAKNAPAKNEWYWLDRQALAAELAVDDLGSFYIAAVPAGGGVAQAYPIAQPPRLNIRNSHVQYAFTWFALAAALAVIYMLVLRQTRGDPHLP